MSIMPGGSLPRIGMRFTSGFPAASCLAGVPWVRARPPPSTNGVTRSTKPSPCSSARTSVAASVTRTVNVFPDEGAPGGEHVRLAGRPRVDVRAVADVAGQEGLERIETLARAVASASKRSARQGGGGEREEQADGPEKTHLLESLLVRAACPNG